MSNSGFEDTIEASWKVEYRQQQKFSLSSRERNWINPELCIFSCLILLLLPSPHEAEQLVQAPHSPTSHATDLFLEWFLSVFELTFSMQGGQTFRAGCHVAISLVKEFNSTLDLKITQSLPEINNVHSFKLHQKTSHQHWYPHDY